MNIYNTNFTSTAGSRFGATLNNGVFLDDDYTVNLYNSTFNIADGGYGAYGLNMDNHSGQPSKINMYGGSITVTSNSVGYPVYDIQPVAGGFISVDENVVYDTASTSAIYGGTLGHITTGVNNMMQSFGYGTTNLGIGTTSPFATLSVNGQSNGTKTIFAVSTTSSSGSRTVFAINPNGTFVVNTPTATSTINGNLNVTGSFHAGTTYANDLVFANGFRVIEAPLDGTTQGILVKNQNGSANMSVDENGNLTVSGDICANGAQCFGKSLGNISSYVSALASSTSLAITSIGMNSAQSLAELSSSVSGLNKAVLTLSDRIDLLASTTALLSSSATSSSTAASITSNTANTLASSTPSFIGRIAQAVEDLISSAGNWVVQKITATFAVFTHIDSQSITTETASVSNGIEMKDKKTGIIYCITLSDGAFEKQQGSCSAASSTQAASDGENAPVSAAATKIDFSSQAKDSRGTDQNIVRTTVVQPVASTTHTHDTETGSTASSTSPTDIVIDPPTVPAGSSSTPVTALPINNPAPVAPVTVEPVPSAPIQAVPTAVVQSESSQPAASFNQTNTATPQSAAAVAPVATPASTITPSASGASGDSPASNI